MITLQHGGLHSDVDNCSCHEFPILLTIGQTEYTTMGEPFFEAFQLDQLAPYRKADQ